MAIFAWPFLPSSRGLARSSISPGFPTIRPPNTTPKPTSDEHGGYQDPGRNGQESGSNRLSISPAPSSKCRPPDQLGSDLKKSFAEEDLILKDREDLLVQDAEQVNTLVDGEKPDLILNCSAFHRVDDCEDQLAEWRFEFIPFWGFLVFLLYTMRRVDCRRCQAVVVEEVPWADGKRTLTKAYMLFLARWARRLSWKETAEAFRTSWDKVFDAVEHVVTWGLEHRVLGQIDAIGVDEIGVDEIQYAKGHKYLTLVYQIDLDVTRLLWVGKERTIESFQGFFTAIGKEIASKIVFVCSDMWEPYPKVIREKCSEALHIFDRFHIVAKMNKALDDVRAGESRRMALEGLAPVLKKSRWLLLKREENLKTEQRFRLRDLLRYNLRTVRAYLLKEAFQQLWDYNSPPGPGSSSMNGAARSCGPASSPRRRSPARCVSIES